MSRTLRAPDAEADAEAQAGVTLVELMAAIMLSALAVALASRLLLSGQNQFLARVFETDRLSALVRLKGALHQALAGEIVRCEGGRLTLGEGAPSGAAAREDMAAWVKRRFPGADSVVFRCYELAAGGDGLVEWKTRFQPQLVEYGVTLRNRGKADRLEGSVLR